MSDNFLFDAHVHLWEPGEEQYPFDPSFGPPPQIGAPLTALLSLMKRYQVSRAALIQPGHYGFDAGLVADLVARHPQQFVGIGMVDPSRPDVAVRLNYWVMDRGLVGMRVLGRWLGAPYIEALWQRAAELGASLSFLTGPVDLEPLERLLKRLPPAVILLDHFAHRRLNDRRHCQQLLDLARYPNVYAKMSGLYALSNTPHPHADAGWLIQEVIHAFGPRRLLWASDYPYIVDTCGYGACLELFHKQIAFLTQEERDWICGKTAQSLWPLLSA